MSCACKLPRKLCIERQSTVEPVLVTLVNFLGIRRVNTRGIELANKYLLTAAIAYHVKKMMKFEINRPMAAMMELPKDANQFFDSLFYNFIFAQ